MYYNDLQVTQRSIIIITSTYSATGANNMHSLHKGLYSSLLLKLAEAS